MLSQLYAGPTSAAPCMSLPGLSSPAGRPHWMPALAWSRHVAGACKPWLKESAGDIARHSFSRQAQCTSQALRPNHVTSRAAIRQRQPGNSPGAPSSCVSSLLVLLGLFLKLTCAARTKWLDVGGLFYRQGPRGLAGFIPPALLWLSEVTAGCLSFCSWSQPWC